MIDYTLQNYIILHKKNQLKILGYVERDSVTLRLSAMVAVQIEDGRISKEVPIQRSKLQRSTQVLDWIKDYDEEFSDDDFEIIKRKVEALLLNAPKKIDETSEQATTSEVLEKLTEYIEICSGEVITPDGKMLIRHAVFIRNGYGYIRTTKLSEFISENKDMGWSRLEILKLLKRNGLLQTGKDRTYDKKIKINGSCDNYYVIKLPQDKTGNLLKNEPDEIIEIDREVEGE